MHGDGTRRILHRIAKEDQSVTALGTQTSPVGVEELVTIPDRDRFIHLFASGPTRSGKTQAMLHYALQDAAKGYGLCLINPKGDATAEFLAKLPANRVDDVRYVNPARPDMPGFNILEPVVTADMTATHRETQVELIATDIVGLFKRRSQSWGDRFGSYLDTLTRALVKGNMQVEPAEAWTLLDMYRCVADEEVLTTLIDRTDDPVLRAELVELRDELTAREREPLKRRIKEFLANGTVRDMLDTPMSDLDIPGVVADGKILLVDVRKGEVGTVVAELLGALIISKVWAAAQARVTGTAADIPFFLYVDELPNFTGEASTLATMLAEAREFRLGCVLACQYLHQLPRQLRQAVETNCRTTLYCGPAGNEDLPAMPAHVDAKIRPDAYQAVVNRPDRDLQVIDTLPPYPAPRDPDTVDQLKEQAATRATQTTDGHDATSQPTQPNGQVDSDGSEQPGHGNRPLPLGHPAVAGKTEHQEVLHLAKYWFEEGGFQVDLLYQAGGRGRPDGRIHTGEAVWHLEAECGTASKPARILQNLRRAHEQADGCVFVVPADRAERVANVVADPVNRQGTDHEDAHGAFSYYQGRDGAVTDVEALRQVPYRVVAVTDDELTQIAQRLPAGE